MCALELLTVTIAPATGISSVVVIVPKKTALKTVDDNKRLSETAVIEASLVILRVTIIVCSK